MSLKGPTVKRILKEAAELSTSPSPDYHAAPLDSDLYTWHFTLRGPSAPSPFATGIYHGTITLPPSYPLKPPNFRFLTPSGRFEVNREICLSISAHHEESWQPAWGIRTALVALRAHMDGEAGGGQLGGMRADEGVRVRLAGESRGWRCAGCGGRSNEEVLGEQERLCAVLGEEEGKKRRAEEEVARGISFEVKGDGGRDGGEASASAAVETGSPVAVVDGPPVQASTSPQSSSATDTPAIAHPNHLQLPPSLQVQQPQTRTQIQHQPAHATSRDIWLDRAIVGVVVALVFMVLRQLY